jgi:hypothetical protein
MTVNRIRGRSRSDAMMQSSAWGAAHPAWRSKARELNKAQMHVSGVPEASSPGSVEQINRRHLGVPNTAMVRYPRVATSIVPVPLCFQKSPPGRFVRYLGTVLLITSCLLLILGDIKNSTLIVWSDSI